MILVQVPFDNPVALFGLYEQSGSGIAIHIQKQNKEHTHAYIPLEMHQANTAMPKTP